MKLYRVHVTRVIRLRLCREWVVGTYWFRWYARLVAWMYFIDSDNVWQEAAVEEI